MIEQQIEEIAQGEPNKNIKNNKTELNTWKIGTLNVRGLNDEGKKIALLEYMSEQNYDIIGLTETSLPTNQQ